MGLWDLIRAVMRRWPLVLVAMVLTGACAFLVTRDPGVYWTRAEVAFLAPSSTSFPNSVQTRSEDLIITAGAVAKRVVGPDKEPKYGSTGPTIVGTTGQREGYWIRLPDTGGQWGTHFADQILLVDVVGPTPDRVRELEREAVGRIREELLQMQQELGVNEFSLITVRDASESTVIYRIAGNRQRAVLMVGVLGAALTVAAVAALERRALRRQNLPGVIGDAVTTERAASGV